MAHEFYTQLFDECNIFSFPFVFKKVSLFRQRDSICDYISVQDYHNVYRLQKSVYQPIIKYYRGKSIGIYLYNVKGNGEE